MKPTEESKTENASRVYHNLYGDLLYSKRKKMNELKSSCKWHT